MFNWPAIPRNSYNERQKFNMINQIPSILMKSILSVSLILVNSILSLKNQPVFPPPLCSAITMRQIFIVANWVIISGVKMIKLLVLKPLKYIYTLNTKPSFSVKQLESKFFNLTRNISKPNLTNFYFFLNNFENFNIPNT